MSLRTISEPLHVFGNASTATIPMIAAMINPNRTVAIHQIVLTASAATSVTVQDTSGAALSETFQLGPTKALILDQLDNTDPWFTTAPGLGVQLAQSGSANIGFDAWYLGGPFYSAPPGSGPAPVVYATWNPADLSNVTLGGNNLVATTTTASAGARTSKAMSAGKYYFEIALTNVVGLNSGVGIGLATASFGTTVSGNATGVAGTDVNTQRVYVNGVNETGTNPLGGLATGAVVGVAVDMTAKQLWMCNVANHNWNGINGVPGTSGAVDISAIATGPLYPMLMAAGTGGVYTINCGASPFVGSVPSGFAPGIF